MLSGCPDRMGRAQPEGTPPPEAAHEGQTIAGRHLAGTSGQLREQACTDGIYPKTFCISQMRTSPEKRQQMIGCIDC